MFFKHYIGKLSNFHVCGVPVMVQWKRIGLRTMGLWVQSLALFSGLRIQCCCDLWCRPQMHLRSLVAVAVM